MNNIQLNIDKALGFVSKDAVYAYANRTAAANKMLHEGTGKGNDFLGWVNLPSSTTDAFLSDIQATADILRSQCEAVVVAGIGGSYLGAKAVIEALNNGFDWLQKDRKNPVILYAGNNISEDYLAELTEYLKGKSFGIIN
ncbi:MAG: glucose-6-phosphate isomerase, partial [Bacteroidota bacterium]|nr:glucose-6-phosphate isomerase [Bacteroidota bacterium]